MSFHDSRDDRAIAGAVNQAPFRFKIKVGRFWLAVTSFLGRSVFGKSHNIIYGGLDWRQRNEYWWTPFRIIPFLWRRRMNPIQRDR